MIMEVKIYDIEGNVIAEDKNTDGNGNPGHYDIDLTEKKSGIQFIKKTIGKIYPKKNIN